MRNTILKLKSIELENFKNVKYGKIDLKEDKINNTICNILGIYGQNGSGKTSIINALYLLKLIVSGKELNENTHNYICSNENSASLGFEFRLYEDDEEYKIYYKFEIRKKESPGNSLDDYYCGMADVPNALGIPNVLGVPNVLGIPNASNTLNRATMYDMEENLECDEKKGKNTKVEVSKEKLSYSKLENNQWKNRVTIIDYDIDDEEYTFRPIKNYREIANTNNKKVTLGIAKGLSQEKSTSFVFSAKTFPLLLQSFSKNNSNNAKLIMSLRTFALFNLFVIQNDDLGVINSNILMPFSYMLKNERNGSRGSIPIRLFETSVIEINSFDTVERILQQINIVISTIVPNLKIKLKNYGKETMANGREGYKVELLSVRGENSIPLKYESDGIKKIISIMSVLIGMFNNENIIVAIDELDAGVFEYLLGEILEILSKSAKGQLIFTSHNLRALEKLSKDLVVFTTTNPHNRYISLSNVKGTNNLRDFYYRGIILGGQREELYDQTNKYEMSYAFRKAWMMNNGEN